MAKQNPLVSIIVVNFNGKKYLRPCFKSLSALDYPVAKIEIVMVDNLSHDGSVEFVRKNFPKVKIIRNDVNNYSKANNIGILQARGEYVVTLNNDCIVSKIWLKELVKPILSDISIAATASKVLYMDGRIQSSGHRKLPNFYWEDRGTKEDDQGQYDQQEEVCSASGCSVLYRKSDLLSVGLFDEDFNLYLEDVDIFLRLKTKKKRVIYVPSSVVQHVHHATARESLAEFYSERNRLFLIAKHYPDKLPEALLGRGYFTAQHDIKAQARLYVLLTDLVFKLIKHNKEDRVRKIMQTLFTELKNITNYENILLKDKIESAFHTIADAKNSISEKDRDIVNLRKDLTKRRGLLKEKDIYNDSLRAELDKWKESLKEKDGYINSLNLELGKRDEILKEKDRYTDSLQQEVSKLHARAADQDEKLRALLDGLKAHEELLKEKDIYNDSLRAELDKWKESLKEKDGYINSLNLELGKRDEILKEKDRYTDSLQQEVSKLHARAADQDEKLRALLDGLKAHEELLKEKDIYNDSLRAELDKWKESLKEKDGYINSLNLELGKRDEILKEKDRYTDSLQQEVSKLHARAADQDEKLRALLDGLKAHEELLKEKDIYNDSLRAELDKWKESLKEKDGYINSLNLELGKLNKEMERSQAALQEQCGRNGNLIQELSHKEKEIKGLYLDIEQKIKTIEGIYNSTIFRFFVKPLWWLLWNIKKALRASIIMPESVSLLSKNAEPETPEAQIGICTIISKNYLSYARVLTDSFLKKHNAKVFVLLTDKVDGFFDPNQERFTMVTLDAIKDKIPDFDAFCFQYNPTEFNTAVKPFFLEYLFQKFGLQKLVFFDPDILINQNMDELFALLSGHSIVLIPHITQPFEDTRQPNEMNILKSGVYNLGFLGLAYTETTRKLLAWWKERLKRYCVSDVENGLFVDQRWMDLVPGFFEDVYILKDKRYNIAYWNYHYRKVSLQGADVYMDGAPVYFLHFSGFNPDDLEIVSVHQKKYTLGDFPYMKPVFELYKEKLLQYGYKETHNWPCVFNYFDNGVKIPAPARRLYWGMDNNKRSAFGNPFCAGGKDNFYQWLNSGIDNKKPKITRLMHGIYLERPDVREAFRDELGIDRQAFVKWFQLSSKREYLLDDIFLLPPDSEGSSAPQMNIKLQLFYQVRGWVRLFCKRLFRNDLVIISKLRKLEINLYKLYISMKTKPVIGKDIEKNAPLRKNGVNVIGYINAEHGVGQAVRANIDCLQAVGFEAALINLSPTYVRQLDTSFTQFSSENPFPINLIHVNADMLPAACLEKGREYFQGKYNIGFWTWELTDFPDAWCKSFKYCDEIWVPSSFVLEAISKKSPLPVIRIPHAVEIKNLSTFKRGHFGLHNNEFIFLFVFDFLSYFERKNPLGLIQAFKSIFSASEPVRLVIKCVNSSFNPQAFQRMREAAAGHNISIIDNYLRRDEIYALMSLCDCYASLHRSEGFGLTLAEAMYLGKPVIATGYSGNLDFMDAENSYLIKYKLAEIREESGPYKKGNIWAEPDRGYAAELMHFVYTHKKEADLIGQKAAQHVRTYLNTRVIGGMMKERISIISGHSHLSWPEHKADSRQVVEGVTVAQEGL